jgi:predicted metal-dependent hydrolase
MLSLLAFLLGFSLGWAACREYSFRHTAQQLLQAEQKYQESQVKARERELSLIDTYLRKQNVAPLEVQRESVLRVPDPEMVRPRDYVDEAIRLDEIWEIAQERDVEASWTTSADEARAKFPQLWKQCEVQWEAEHTPLRV